MGICYLMLSWQVLLLVRAGLSGIQTCAGNDLAYVTLNLAVCLLVTVIDRSVCVCVGQQVAFHICASLCYRKCITYMLNAC